MDRAVVIALVLFCAAPGAWAEDGVAVEVVPAQAQDAPRQPDMVAVGAHVDQFGKLMSDFERKHKAEDAAFVEGIKTRKAAKGEGEIQYTDGEGNFSSYFIDGETVTKQDYIANRNRIEQQRREQTKAMNDFSETTRFGIKQDEEGFEGDEQIKAMRDREQTVNQERDTRLKERAKEIMKQDPVRVPSRTLISTEQGDEKAPEPR